MKRPSDIAKTDTEFAHQSAFFCYCSIAYYVGFRRADMWAFENKEVAFIYTDPPKLPQIKWIHAIKNQGHGDVIRGGRSKAEGVKAGVADIFLPFPTGKPFDMNPSAGLYIEMKKPSEKPKKSNSKGGMSDDQIAFSEYARSVGYSFETCYSWVEAVLALKKYLGYKHVD